jgi:hypothetical protein
MHAGQKCRGEEQRRPDSARQPWKLVDKGLGTLEFVPLFSLKIGVN